MTREDVRRALDAAVAESNRRFELEDWHGAERWHWRAVALQELLGVPEGTVVH